jgi:nucleotide-binding universal stress UspA family protein
LISGFYDENRLEWGQDGGYMKNIVISVDLKDECLAAIKAIKNEAYLKDAKIHLVHCFETHTYAGEFYLGQFPSADMYDGITSSVNEILTQLASEFEGEVATECFFTPDAMDKMIEFIDQVSCDMAIVPTRGLNMLERGFKSSFAEYLVRHARCPVLVLRADADE